MLDIIDNILNNKINAVSLDIFDTILLRNAASEEERFYKIAIGYQEKLAESGFYFSLKDLFYLRCACHHMAYRASPLVNGVREPGIRLIVEALCSSLSIDPLFVPKLISIDVDYEVHNLRVNWRLLRDVKVLQNYGVSVFLISDMYLRESDLNFIITRLCPGFAFEKIYVSSDFSASKHSNGGLFDIFLAEQKYNASEVMHIGDNYCSDVLQAQRKGIACIYLPRNKVFVVNRTIRKYFFEFIKKRDFYDNL